MSASAGFGDIDSDDWYAAPVQWLVNNEITTGVSEGCFGPDQTVTRGQLATFLWRHAGEPNRGSHDFTDVTPDRFYNDAVGWMARRGITTGTSATTFSPDDSVTRGQVATFLHRYANEPSAPASNFSDVDRSAFYAEAVDWMVDQGITKGTTSTTFSPDRTLTRAEFAAFLYRFEGEPPVTVEPGGTCGGGGAGEPGSTPTTTQNPDNPTTTTTTPTTTPTTPLPVGALYANDFATEADGLRIDQFVQYREDFVVDHTTGLSDHASTGGVNCSAPEETRYQTRGNPAGHVYQCLPGGDPDAGHQMSYAMDTSGYGFVGALPDQVFEGVTEVSVDINTTSAGSRNFVEIKIVPADQVFVNALPCIPDLPCNDGWDYNNVDAVGAGTHSAEGTGLWIATPSKPGGYSFNDWESTDLANGDSEYEPCPSSGFCQGVGLHEGNIDIRTRYNHIFRDNGDGTLSFGIEREDGTYGWATAEGSFPDGPVRVVVAFHNYTGTKDGDGPGFDGNLSPSEGGFTWHWDNLVVLGQSATPAIDYFGGTSADRIVTPAGCVSFAQGQRTVTSTSDIAPMFHCKGDPDI